MEPQRVVHVRRGWYLVAFDLDRPAGRPFRADRIGAPRAPGARSRHEMAATDVTTYLQQSEDALAPTYRADVTLHEPSSTVRRRLRDHLGDGELVAVGDGTRWRSAPDTVEWLALRLLALDCHFVVHGPPELRAHLDAIHDRTRP